MSRHRAGRRLAGALLVALCTAGVAGCYGWNVPSVRVTYTYEVVSRGVVYTPIEELAAHAASTYADSRGWRRDGIAFQRVPSGGHFTLVLASPAEVPRFSSACSSFYSCRVGRYVIINDDRWRMASPTWPIGLHEYRQMVVNHETGHWLGLGHWSCPGPAALAPVMVQQSIGLQGCHANPWPTDAELRAV